MLKFSCSKKDKNRVPVLSAKEMDILAEALVGDYKPELLKEAQPIDYEHFLQFYLEADLLFDNITADGSILGLTSFDIGQITIYDMENHCGKEIDVVEGTIILDKHLLSVDKAGRLRFTALHEGSHWWCHKDVYAKNRTQGTYFAVNNHPAVKSRTNSLDNFVFRKSAISKDWMEYQAEYMASALAMPKTPFIVTAEKILSGLGIPDGKIITGVDKDCDFFAKLIFPALIAKAFGVSRKAAEIKLWNFGFIQDIHAINHETHRLAIC
jgi:Zn-dependent peptidase ImmA (M78 family)